MRYWQILFVSLLVLAASAPARAQIHIPEGPRRIGPAVDFDVGGGYATAGHRWGFFGRVGLGIFMLTDHRYQGITATAAYSPWFPYSFGLQGAIASVGSGLGFGAGGHVTTKGTWGVQAGPSLSVLHLEGQLQFDPPRTKALVLYARIPAGVIFKLLMAAR